MISVRIYASFIGGYYIHTDLSPEILGYPEKEWAMLTQEQKEGAIKNYVTNHIVLSFEEKKVFDSYSASIKDLLENPQDYRK